MGGLCPVRNHVGVEVAILSRAVVTYIWADRSLPWPSRRPNAVRAEFPDQADDLIRRVQDVIQSAQDVRPTDDLAETGDLVVAVVRAKFPQLSEEVLQAIGNLYAYSWR